MGNPVIVSSQGNGAYSTTFSTTHTCIGSETLAVMCISITGYWGGGWTWPTPTFNGSNMTTLFEGTNSTTGSSGAVYYYKITSPLTGSKSFSFYLGGTRMRAGTTHLFSTTDPITPISNSTSEATLNATTFSRSVTSNLPGIVFYFVGTWAGSNNYVGSWGSGQSSVLSAYGSNSGKYIYAQTSTKAATSTGSVSVSGSTYTGGVISYTHSAFLVNGIVGGSQPIIVMSKVWQGWRAAENAFREQFPLEQPGGLLTTPAGFSRKRSGILVPA